MRRSLASSLVLAMLCTAAMAEPRPMTKAAKAELERGLAKFAARDYAAAITAFDAGYAIDPHPDFMYAKGQAQRLGGDCRGAISSYKAFLASSPPDKEGGIAKGNIAKCEALLAASQPAEPEPVIEKPPPVVDKPPPVVEAPQPPPVVETPPPPDPWYRDTLGVSLAIGSVASLAVAAGFTVAARSASDDLANAIDIDTWVATRDAWQRDRIIAGIAAGTGLVLGGIAIVRFVTRDPAPRRRDRLTAHVAPGPTTWFVLEGAW